MIGSREAANVAARGARCLEIAGYFALSKRRATSGQLTTFQNAAM